MNIFLTLDYELFMGDKTGTPMNCLFEPMDSMCKMVEKYGVRFTIFVDAAYLIRLQQLSESNPVLAKDYQSVVKHIKSMEESGHDIEFHFHPQWLYSQYDSEINGWRMDREHYKLSDMPQGDLDRFFIVSKSLLDSIIGRKTIAFRAGGYSLTSLEGYYNLLKGLTIKVDSSVCGRNKIEGKYQTYDYTKTPPKSMYRFIDDVSNLVEEGGIIEMPISSSKKYPGIVYLFKKNRLIAKFGKDHRWFIGTGETSFLSKRKRFMELFMKFIKGKSLIASMDYYMSVNLLPLYKILKRQGRKNMVVIGHPKNASPESISQLEFFISQTIGDNNYLTFRDLV